MQLSNSRKITGWIKAKPEDFIVEEITKNGTVLELDKSYDPRPLGYDEAKGGKFAIFVMQKSNWNTIQALKAIARKLKRGIKSTGFAGTKDRTSVSTQLCSLFGASPEELSSVHLKDIKINCAWRGSEKVELGALLGNRFTVKISDISEYGEPEGAMRELGGAFPNYFGAQRFGMRENNVDIGISMLKGDFKSAALEFLTSTRNETNSEAIEARKRLAEELDFKSALRYFPDYLKYERLMIEHLSMFPENYANALRRLPRPLSLMFVHSVEAYIFNKELEERVKSRDIGPKQNDMVCHPDAYGFPNLSTVEKYSANDKKAFIVGNMIGYGTAYIKESESKILDRLGITANSFKVTGMNELNSAGSCRVLFAPYKELSCSANADDRSATFRFSLPAGSYATVLLNEFVRTQVNIS